MAKEKDKNYVSVWFWMLALFVVAIPCVGFVVVIVGAFLGENESRKNYFRAILMWYLLGAIVLALVIALGFLPAILQEVQHWHWKR